MGNSAMMWLTLAVVAVFLEMLTRTFNLLAVAIGFGAAALFAWMGFGVIFDIAVALFVGGGCLVWLRRSPAGNSLQEAEESRYSVMSDDGEEVHISQWDDGNLTEVVFKGRTWEAKLAEGSPVRKGTYKVREVREGKLILEADK